MKRLEMYLIPIVLMALVFSLLHPYEGTFLYYVILIVYTSEVFYFTKLHYKR